MRIGLVALDLIEVFAAAEAAGGGDLRHQKGFRAESFGGALLGIHAEPIDRRADHDDAGDADDHPQQREEAAQLVRADGIGCEAEGRNQFVTCTNPIRLNLRHLSPA